MNSNNIPATIPNWINGEECTAVSGKTFEKLSPHSGQNLCQVARSNEDDVKIAIQAAGKAQAAWADFTPVQRGDMLHDIAQAMRRHQKEIADNCCYGNRHVFEGRIGRNRRRHCRR